MILQQNFNVVPHGLIQEGSVSISADTETGAISEQSKVRVGLGFFAKEFASEDHLKIDPKYLRSANIKEGMSLLFGPVTIKVTGVESKRALASVLVQNEVVNLRGEAVINLTEEFIYLDHVKADGTARGVPAQAELVRV